MTVAVKQNKIQIKTWSRGQSLGADVAQHDGWSTLTFDSSNPKASLKKELSQFEDKEGRLTKPLNLRAKGEIAKETIFSYQGANVTRNVRLSNNPEQTAGLFNNLKNQLYEIEKDLRAGRRINVTVDCKEVALYARATLGKLLRMSEFNGNYDPIKALLKVYVKPTEGQNKKEILDALGPRLVYKSDVKLNNSTSKSTKWNWQSLLKIFNVPNTFLSQKKSNELGEIKNIIRQDTPYEEKQKETISKNLLKAAQLLEKKRQSLSNGEEGLKPLVIKVNTIEELNIALSELRKMSQKYNEKGQQPLLQLSLPPEVKKFYKEVILKPSSQKTRSQESAQNPETVTNNTQGDELQNFYAGVKERAFPDE
jgi:hypothetical protein